MYGPFPIYDVIPQLRRTLDESTLAILQAPPGAGKSTILPLELLNEAWLEDKTMIILEPRRLAARAVAERMASLLGEQVGQTIGYRIRFENKTSAKTRILVVTEGILTRMLQQDNSLEGIGLVLFDEFHERSLHADLSLALSLQVQQVLRPELRVLIMSATLNTGHIQKALPHAPIITSDGRQYPVQVKYMEENTQAYISDNMASAIRLALKEQQGDILCFLPGAGEIRQTEALLDGTLSGVLIYPLYGDLPFSQQQDAIVPNRQGVRKIVLATSIAETSLTIEGITTVIDSGYSRGSLFDPRSGLTKLHTYRVSKDTADQRAGRAGRLGPGVAYRLWSEHTQLHLAAHRKPEILEADLSPFMLELYQWGSDQLQEFTWIDAPPVAHVAQANELLEQLEAVKEHRITAYGRQMLRFPTHPRLAHMFMLAAEWDKQQPGNRYTCHAADVAAVLEERDPLDKAAGTDMVLRLEAMVAYRKKERVNADRKALERLEKLASSYRNLLKLQTTDYKPDEYSCGKLIAAAYPERIARRIAKNGNQYRLANGRTATIQAGDPILHEEWIAVALLDGGQREGKIFSAAPLDTNDVKHLAHEAINLEWDKDTGTISATEDLVIGKLVLSRKPFPQPGAAQRLSILCEAIRDEGLKAFGWEEADELWQYRIMSLKAWRPEESWPDLSSEKILENLEQILEPYIADLHKRSDFKKVHWLEMLTALIPWELQQKTETLAPEKWLVPSGSLIPVVYYPDGKQPELHVRLQEVFGMLETPKINNGQTKLLMTLLSPGYKPVQVTGDLMSFWKTTYHEVRKELRLRYPKHSWPEDPFTAEAVRGVRKKTS
ncbi:MAG: ATP-dependent helicase HrpB [Bacteroidetes bacterium]|nr:ATP-dependent helicase HrpB [Bacteroidota bacterium]